MQSYVVSTVKRAHTQGVQGTPPSWSEVHEPVPTRYKGRAQAGNLARLRGPWSPASVTVQDPSLPHFAGGWGRGVATLKHVGQSRVSLGVLGGRTKLCGGGKDAVLIGSPRAKQLWKGSGRLDCAAVAKAYGRVGGGCGPKAGLFTSTSGLFKAPADGATSFTST